MAPAADATVRSPVLERAVERIAIGPYVRLAGMVRIVGLIRRALAEGATCIEIDVQHLQTITEGARLLFEAVGRDAEKRGGRLVFVRAQAEAA